MKAFLRPEAGLPLLGACGLWVLAAACHAGTGAIASESPTEGAAHEPSPAVSAPRAAPPPAEPTAAEALPLWEIGFGVGWASLPQYRGSDQQRSWVLPVPYLVYRGDVFKSDRDGARAEVLDVGPWSLDLSAALNPPLPSQDSRARQGMADLPATVELGPRLNWTWHAPAAGQTGWTGKLRLPLRSVAALRKDSPWVGMLIEPSVTLDRPLPGGGQWGVAVSGLWGNRAWHSFLYEVPPENATTDRPAWSARGGYAGWQATVGATRRWGRLWGGAFVRYDRISGLVQDSPLVQRRQNFSFGLGFAWELARSADRVLVEP